MELAEHLGSAVPRIPEISPRKCFRFTENFIRFTMPNAWDLSEDEENTELKEQVGEQVGEQVKEQVKRLILHLNKEQ